MSEFKLTTERLYLREFKPSDAKLLYELNSDVEVIKYTGDSAFSSVKEAQGLILNYNQYKLYKMGRWAVCLKSNREFLGWCGLKYHKDSNLVEVGFRFFQKHWNKGYATESAIVSINYGFHSLNLKEIYAHAHIENLASQKVIEKCGLQLLKEGNYDGMPAKLYKIKTNAFVVTSISARETYPIRQVVLRKGKPLSTCKFEGDMLPTTFHFGLHYNNTIAGIATVLKQPNDLLSSKNAYQLRGMAILEEYQGYGFGEALIKHIENHLKQLNTPLLWCNARTSAAKFYLKHKFKQSGPEFSIPNVGPHLSMYKSL